MIYTPDNQRYQNIKYRRCGNSGLLLPEISLGLWHNFGGVDVFEDYRKIIQVAFDKGITHFDLANNYGPPPGSAEENFGVIFKKDLANYRDELIISTKAGYRMWEGPYGEWGSKKYLVSSLDQSLKRMGLDYVDIFYSHRPDPHTPIEETMGALDLFVKQGKALYVGISSYSAQETIKAIKILKDLGTPCLIHQPKYSMLDRWVEDELLDVLVEKGIGCIPFSPLAQGLLSDKYINGIPKDSRANKPHGFLQKEHITDAVLSKIKALNELAKIRNQSLAQMAIAWLLQNKAVTSVLIGVSSVNQLNNSLAAVSNTHFEEYELAKINQILEN